VDADLGIALEQLHSRVEISEERILSAVAQTVASSAAQDRTVKSLIVLMRWLVLGLVALASPEALKVVMTLMGH